MSTHTLQEPVETLGSFLRERRSRLQPEDAEGASRRRTPGLRREEVAARANVSVAWYTWLEQNRGGPPSADVLERLARALELDETGREMLFLLGQQRPPPLTPPHRSLSAAANAAPFEVSRALQAVLDGQPLHPAIVKTPAWDIVAWNEAASAVLADYEATPPEQRNVMRRLFSDPAVKAALPDWEQIVRWSVAVFRVDIARSGTTPEVAALTAELQAGNADFARIWAESEVRNHGSGTKRLMHEIAGPLQLDYSAFAVADTNALTMIVFTPVTPADARAIESLILQRRARKHAANPAQ
ncbi:helix-turn-helix transcriptional regulator [Paraburkholderia acidisoli]|uniref:Helix-turn-helix domain-containing protein n=1 Tax=Paraburkholderia acidisoli TaxID=2571748 RepID=A0A7Z2GRW2_9BURK|nr:helix-turn-helix transcriptional regulator [Paraburkholderia acidisoli]QGZ66826.1 helix-turn-helix domain-containing protein [Paraburkholderia acidisoli]